MSKKKIPGWYYGTAFVVPMVLLGLFVLVGTIEGGSLVKTVVGVILFAGVVGSLVMSFRAHQRSQNLFSQSSPASGRAAAVCRRCGETQAFVADTCQRCGATRATSTILTPKWVAVSTGAVVLTLLAKFVMKTIERAARRLPWWHFLLLFLLEIVAIMVVLVLTRPSAFGSRVAMMLGRFVKLDDGRFGAMVLDKPKPADWLGSHWAGSAPDAFLAAVASGRDKWVTSGKVDELPMMFVCFDHRKKPTPRPAELHLFVAHPRPDCAPGKTDLLAYLTALGCGVQILELGVYVSHSALEDILSVEDLRAICLRAAELAREGTEVSPCS